MNPSRCETLRALAQKIQEIEASRHTVGWAIRVVAPHVVARSPDRATPVLQHWWHGQETVPQRGSLPTELPADSLVELLSATEGAGAFTLSLFMARSACRSSSCYGDGERGKWLVIIDSPKCFYPPAAARLGIDLDRTIIIRPTKRRDACAAVDQCLRCAAVAAVVGWFDQISSMEFRRLQLAAQTGRTLGLLLRPATALKAPSFATLRLLVAPIPSAEASQRIQVDVLRYRGGKSGQSVILEIDHETGDVRLPAAMAPTTTAARLSRTSG